jgi:hypothetical protein
MDLEAELLKTISREELERKVGEKIKSFHGLLTREVALRLLAKESGLLNEKERTYALAEIPPGAKKAAFRAAITRIWPVAQYGSGKRSRVVEVGDGTATRPLVLWNEDVELAHGLRLKDEIMVKGAYEKNGELHLGYSGAIEVVARSSLSELGALEEGGSAHVRGFVSSVGGYADSGKKAFLFSITDGKAERQCVVSGGMDRAQRLNEGDEVLIEGAAVRDGQLELAASARLHIRRPKDLLLGKVTKMECAGESLLMDVGGREVALSRESALRLMRVEIAGDIALSTVVSLKKDMLLNTKIAARIEEKDGQIVIRG